MNKLIQDYIDGQMSQSERANFEAQLASDASLRAELEACMAFKAAVKSAGLTEPTPNLQPMLANICRPQVSFWRTKGFTWSASALACFAIVFTVAQSPLVNPTAGVKEVSAATISLEKSPLRYHWHESDPAKAAALIRANMKCPVPVLTLDGLGANLISAECGSCWIAFDIEYQGSVYAIFGRRESGGLDAGRLQKFEEKELFVFNDAVGWYCEGEMTYIVKGGNAAGRLAIAKYACKETPKGY